MGQYYQSWYKFNEDRRHKIARQKFTVTNWSAHNESLRRFGDLIVWLSDEALSLWTAPRRTSQGGQPKYLEHIRESGNRFRDEDMRKNKNL
jgi:hypothetical protein